MILIRYTEENSCIKSFTVSGHSGSGEKGEDLVCAAVSGIVFGLCNAADILLANRADITIGDNKIEIVIAEPDQQSDPVMRTGLIQCKTIEESQPEYVKIKMEV